MNAIMDSSEYLKIDDNIFLHIRDWGQGTPIIIIPVWPFSHECPSDERTAEIELTVSGGETVVYNPGDGHSRAIAPEYRHKLWRFLESTAGAIYEGRSGLIDRYGLTTQLWMAKPFLDDRIALGVGIGPYFALDSRLKTQQVLLPIMFSSTGSYSINENWLIPATWNRFIASYDRDTDIFLSGIGYCF